MNRQQRRVLKKQRAAEKRVEQKMLDAKCNPKEIEVELYYTAFGLALEEVYGFKKNRILKAWKRADELMEGICKGETTLNQMKEELKKRADIECSFN